MAFKSTLHTIFVWLNSAPSVVITFHIGFQSYGYKHHFQSYGYKHHLQVSSIVVTFE